MLGFPERNERNVVFGVNRQNVVPGPNGQNFQLDPNGENIVLEINGQNIVLEPIEENVVPQANDLDCVEDKLWLGNFKAATTPEVFVSRKISHILTVNSWPLPRDINELKAIKNMYISVADSQFEDLLSHFEATFEFIESGLKNGSVLVHCHQGISRSATLIIAYLMKKYNMTVENAYEFAKSKRNVVKPNSGFMCQLKLYEMMEWKIIKSNMQYKMFRLYIAAEKIKKSEILPKSFEDVVKPDPSLIVESNQRVYRCKKCRRVLALDSNIIPHFPAERYCWTDSRYSSNEAQNFCDKIYFVEPVAWMQIVTVSQEGKLYCPNPKCQVKLGSYCWGLGRHCLCGTVVSPAFYLLPSKVDKEIFIRHIHVPL